MIAGQPSWVCSGASDGWPWRVGGGIGWVVAKRWGRGGLGGGGMMVERWSCGVFRV